MTNLPEPTTDGPLVVVTWWCGHQTQMAIPMRDGVGALHSQQVGYCPACRERMEGEVDE